MCYNIFHDNSSIKPTDLFTLAPRVGTRGHPYKIQVQHTSVEARRRFFSCRVVERWNALPDAVVLAPNVNAFKRKLAQTIPDTLTYYHPP